MYIKKYESFSQEKRMNEEFIGAALKSLKNNLKNKLSLKFSKMFGSAKEADNLMKQYAKERYIALEQKKGALRAYSEYIKAIKEGDKPDQDEVNKLKTNLKTATVNYDKQVDLIRKKFDIKFGEIVEDEKNKKIQNYINLKKIELEQDLLSQEIKSLLTDAGLSDQDRKADPEFNKMINAIEQKIEASKVKAKEQVDALNNKDEGKDEGKDEEATFPIQKAKEAAEKDIIYKWEKSPFIKHEFRKDEKITYWSKTYYNKNKNNYIGTEAIVEEESNSNNPVVKVTVGDNKGIKINKGAIMKSESYDEKKNAKAQEENK